MIKRNSHGLLQQGCVNKRGVGEFGTHPAAPADLDSSAASTRAWRNVSAQPLF